MDFPGGTVIKDQDGNRWILLVSKEQRRWERLTGHNYHVYSTLDNGGRPFDVIVTTDTIMILANKEEPKHVLTSNYKQIFIGTDPGVPDSEGNSVLVNTDHGYIYIGTEIYCFQTTSPVLEFYSPIGNNDVPYPYAVTQTQVYLLEEKVVIPNIQLTFYDTHQGLDDTPGEPYQEYYEHKSKGTPFKYELIHGRSGSAASLINIWNILTMPYRM